MSRILRIGPLAAACLIGAASLSACRESSTTEPDIAVFDPSRLAVTAPSGEPGKATEVLVEARDTENRVFTGPVSGLVMEVRGPNADAATTVSDRGDGTHVLSYAPADLGVDTLDVTLDGEPVAGSPFVSWVRTVFQAAAGTPTLDGSMASGEWDGATAYPVFAGPLSGSTVRFLADATNLYVAFRVADPDITSGGDVGVRFDNTLDHVTSGDDVIAASDGAGFYDAHFAGNIAPDVTEDGAAAGAAVDGWSVVEIRHPLSSGDAQDIDVAEAESVGVCLVSGSTLSHVGRDTTTPLDCSLTVFGQVFYAELKLPS